MRKLTCYTWDDDDPSLNFLIEAKAGLRAFWYLCEDRHSGWSALNKAWNRLVAEHRFFHDDPARCAELLERLCVMAESRIAAGAYPDRGTAQAIRSNVETARRAGARIQELFQELDQTVITEEDVTTQRFFARQSR